MILAALPLVAGLTGCKSDDETTAKPANETLIVEGGAKTLQSFLEQGLWDELRVETNQTLTVDGGTVAPLVPTDAMVVNSLFYDTNTIVTYRRKEL